MPGIVGDTEKYDAIARMADSITYESWYKRESIIDGLPAIGIVHHGEKDPTGCMVWRDQSCVAAIYGEISNKDDLVNDGHIKPSKNGIFEAIFEKPSDILPRLDGSFLVCCIDRDKSLVLLATDKLGSRPCYYTCANERLTFASELKAVLGQLQTCSLNAHAIADFLAFELIFGEKTYINEIQSLPSATILEWESGEISKTRYWSFDFAEKGDDFGYIETLIDLYNESVRNTCEHLISKRKIGMELSGGLDSRVLAKVISKYTNDLRTFSYDSNPPGGGNVVIARKIANSCGLQNEATRFDVDNFAPRICEGVKRTDGMASWIHFHNLPFHLDELHKRIDILIDGSGQGELFGENIIPEKLEDNSLHDAILETFESQGFSVFNLNENIYNILREEIDPLNSIKEEIKKSGYRNTRVKLLDVMYSNFYPNFHFRSSIRGTVVGTRHPLINTKLLEHVAMMPKRYYRTNVRGTFGRVPHATSELKFEIVRKLDEGIERIPYDRSKLNPEMPLPLHTAGMLIEYLKRKFGSTKGNIYAEWLREDRYLREFVIGRLDSLCKRSLFNEKVIKELEKSHLEGSDDNSIILARLTTIEIWLQEVLDKAKVSSN